MMRRPILLATLGFTVLLFLAGCRVGEDSARAESSPTSHLSSGFFSEDTYRSLMYGLLDFDEMHVAADAMARSQDRSFIPVLVEMVRFVPPSTFGRPISNALDELSGQPFKGDWPRAMEWLGQQSDIMLPPGFLQWKTDLFASIDENFRVFLSPGVQTRIEISEIVWGGVRKDGIPALTNPPTLTAREATYLAADERVFGVSINGSHKAYPFRILDWHEMANDVVGGRAVALTYCTLCGAGILYDVTAGERRFTFGSSGLLYRSNKLMYDHQTNSLWMSFAGKPVVGTLAHSGIELDILPLTITTWGQWRVEYPDTLVLDINTGHQRDYTPGKAYGSYFASPDTMFPVWQRSDALATKDWVLAVSLNGQYRAYPLDILSSELVSNDVLGGAEIVVVTNPLAGTARAYRRDNRSFVPGPNAQRVVEKAGQTKDVWGFTTSPSATDLAFNTVMDDTGNVWQVTDNALVYHANATLRLERVPTHMAYWFAWYAFHPDTSIYKKN